MTACGDWSRWFSPLVCLKGITKDQPAGLALIDRGGNHRQLVAGTARHALLVFKLSWFKARDETASALRPSWYFFNQAHLLPARSEVPAWDSLRCICSLTVLWR